MVPPASEDAWFAQASAAHHGRWARWTANAVLDHQRLVTERRAKTPWALARILLEADRRPLVRGHRRQVARWIARLLERGLLLRDGTAIVLPRLRDDLDVARRAPQPTAPKPAPRPGPLWSTNALTADECRRHDDRRVRMLADAADARRAWRVDTDRAHLQRLLRALDDEADELAWLEGEPLEHWALRLHNLPPKFTTACKYLAEVTEEAARELRRGRLRAVLPPGAPHRVSIAEPARASVA